MLSPLTSPDREKFTLIASPAPIMSPKVYELSPKPHPPSTQVISDTPVTSTLFTGHGIKTAASAKKKSLVQTRKVAGKRVKQHRVTSTNSRESSTDSVEFIAIISPSLHGDNVETNGKNSSADSKNKQQRSKEKPAKKRFSRCPKEKKHLCEICSKEDCGVCSNCLNRSTRHQSCKEKPKNKCITWIKEHSQESANNEIDNHDVTSSAANGDVPISSDIPESNTAISCNVTPSGSSQETFKGDPQVVTCKNMKNKPVKEAGSKRKQENAAQILSTPITDISPDHSVSTGDVAGTISKQLSPYPLSASSVAAALVRSEIPDCYIVESTPHSPTELLHTEEDLDKVGDVKSSSTATQASNCKPIGTPQVRGSSQSSIKTSSSSVLNSIDNSDITSTTVGSHLIYSHATAIKSLLTKTSAAVNGDRAFELSSPLTFSQAGIPVVCSTVLESSTLMNHSSKDPEEYLALSQCTSEVTTVRSPPNLICSTPVSQNLSPALTYSETAFSSSAVTPPIMAGPLQPSFSVGAITDPVETSLPESKQNSSVSTNTLSKVLESMTKQELIALVYKLHSQAIVSEPISSVCTQPLISAPGINLSNQSLSSLSPAPLAEPLSVLATATTSHQLLPSYSTANQSYISSCAASNSSDATTLSYTVSSQSATISPSAYNQHLSDTTSVSSSHEPFGATAASLSLFNTGLSPSQNQPLPLSSALTTSSTLSCQSLPLLDQTTNNESQDDENTQVIKKDDDVDEVLKTGLREGVVQLNITKCGVSGPPGSGKSHVRALILGLKRPLQRQSTDVATEADQATPDLNRLIDDSVHLTEDTVNMQVHKWQVVKGDNIARLLANTIHNKEYIKRVATAANVPMPSDSGLKFKIYSSILKHLKRMIKGKNPRKTKGLHGINFMYFIDTGGQPQFQEILPNFVKCTVNLLVHNLSQDLKEYPEFNCVYDGQAFTLPEELRISNIDIIEQSVRSITSTRTHTKPYVAIVGTFKDKCQQVVDFEGVLKEKTAMIKAQLKRYEGCGSLKCETLSFSRTQEQIIFAVDGSEQGWLSNTKVLDALKSHILSCAEKCPVKVPIRYYLFLCCIKEYVENQHISYMTLEECTQFASYMYMDSDDLSECLKVFNDYNLLLYFPNFLPDVIFIKPDFLFKKVSKLIISSYCFQNDIMKNEREKFRHTGIFNRDFLNHINLEGLSGQHFNSQHFLTLLSEVFIIAELDRDRYFMPCVLPLQEISSVQEVRSITNCMESNGIACPLMISYCTTKMSPRGLFCALVVALAKTWKLNDRDNKIRCRNAIEFDIVPLNSLFRTSLGEVIVIDMNSYLEVYTTTCEISECYNIQSTICTALLEASNNLSYSLHELGVEVGLPCTQCSVDERHVARITYSTSKMTWMKRCSINAYGRIHTSLQTSERVWFEKNTHTIGENGTPPTLQQLCNDVVPYTNALYGIAIGLGLSVVAIQRIEWKEDDIGKCLIKVFQEWEKQHMPPYTWQTLVEVLKSPSVDANSLAGKLSKKYL